MILRWYINKKSVNDTTLKAGFNYGYPSQQFYAFEIKDILIPFLTPNGDI